MADGITLGTKLRFAAFALCLMPLVAPCACLLMWRQRVAASAATARTGGRLRYAALSPAAAMLSLLPMMLAVSAMLPASAVMPVTDMIGLIGAAAVTLAVGWAAALALGMRPCAGPGLCAAHAFRFDSHVGALTRSWSAPQWMPRWARFALPEAQI
ncbi:hypothetical protein H7U32_02575 [Bifidobacterium pullorum subsp. saeculare]|uniref:Uncharacterized protein n=1 Tax=Bifidobacterium pullorum subsp. saeculare TaxID=78257 RepID=A0A939B9H5_9BIFI|nr:hypothetical protein [Bifidobacterium pullorum]MBM6699230.1 hypothetical protein [Bifidobacterium pullorum subsp. saeculare]